MTSKKKDAYGIYHDPGVYEIGHVHGAFQLSGCYVVYTRE